MATRRPLRILVTDPAMRDWPEFQALMAQGHVVCSVATNFCSVSEYDRIFGPNCAMMNERLRDFLQLQIDMAQREKYQPKGAK